MVAPLSRRLLLSAALASLALPARSAPSARRLRIGFVNPGRSSDRFWQMATQAILAAADHSNVEMIHDIGERDRQRIISLGLELLSKKPDYLLLVNEHRTAVPLLKAAAKVGVPCLMVFSGLTDEDMALVGPPRGRVGLSLLGSLLPDTVSAGADIARALVHECRQQFGSEQPVPLLALGGFAATPSGQERVEGLRRVLAADTGAYLLDSVNVNWSREEARERTLPLLRRQPQTRGIWCANDDIALGAMDAAVSLGRQPGTDLLVVGINWQEEALRAVAESRMVMSMGGHYLLGAWGIAMLRDHADGLNIASAGGVAQRLSLAPLQGRQAARYLARFGGDGWARIDFDRMRQENGRYDLRVGSVLTI